MEGAIMILIMAGTFVLGYFIVNSLVGFLDAGPAAGGARRYRRRKKGANRRRTFRAESFFR